MKFAICRTKNCTLLRVEHDYREDETEEICYQETEDNEVEAFADFLRFLDEHYGPSISRHSPKRIYILVKPGDKHEDFKDDEFP